MSMDMKLGLVEKKDPLIQLQVSKSSIKDLFNNILDQTKAFDYQKTLKVVSTKYKATEIEFYPV